VQAGTTLLIRARLVNTGQVTLTNTRVGMSYDPRLIPRGATAEGLDNSRISQYLLAWTIPMLEPGQTAVLEAQFQTTQANPQTQVIVTSRSNEGALSEESFNFEVLPGAQAPVEPERIPQLPPVQPPPMIPGGPAPIPAPSPGAAVQPAPIAPVQPLPSERLQLSLAAQSNRVRVNDAIRFTLRVVNDSGSPDGQVSIRFRLPNGVSVSRINQRRSPELGEFRNLAGVIYLADIRTMRPGESVDYELVLISNQPQTFDLEVEAVSQRTPGGVKTASQITVIQ
jgi:hypothetical protein